MKKNYFLIGTLLFIVWHAVKLVYEIVTELTFCRLHKAEWYNIAAGKIEKNSNKKSEEPQMKIGFDVT